MLHDRFNIGMYVSWPPKPPYSYILQFSFSLNGFPIKFPFLYHEKDALHPVKNDSKSKLLLMHLEPPVCNESLVNIFCKLWTSGYKSKWNVCLRGCLWLSTYEQGWWQFEYQLAFTKLSSPYPFVILVSGCPT